MFEVIFDRINDVIIYALLIVFVLISALILNNTYTLYHLEKTLTLSEFKSIYQDPNLSACIWVNDPSLRRSKSTIAPPEVIMDEMIKICDTAIDVVDKDFIQPKDDCHTKQDVMDYIGTIPWIIRYKIIDPDWEKNVDNQLKNALKTW